MAMPTHWAALFTCDLCRWGVAAQLGWVRVQLLKSQIPNPQEFLNGQLVGWSVGWGSRYVTSWKKCHKMFSFYCESVKSKVPSGRLSPVDGWLLGLKPSPPPPPQFFLI